jgi:hypothetical protein
MRSLVLLSLESLLSLLNLQPSGGGRQLPSEGCDNSFVNPKLPRFRPPRFVPGFDPLGICNSQVFRSAMWRRHCAPLSVLVAARAYRRARRQLSHQAKGTSRAASLTGNLF